MKAQITSDWAAAGRTHQESGDVALLKTLPDWTIHIPGHPDEFERLYVDALANEKCVYVRLAEDSNTTAVVPTCGAFEILRRGSPNAATVVAVGPMLDRTLAAAADMDLTVVYTPTPHPLDAHDLRQIVEFPQVIIVEPYLVGTSSAALAEAFRDVPFRQLSIGVPNVEHRRYGTAAEHDCAHGLDVAGIRAQIAAFTRVAQAA